MTGCKRAALASSTPIALYRLHAGCEYGLPQPTPSSPLAIRAFVSLLRMMLEHNVSTGEVTPASVCRQMFRVR